MSGAKVESFLETINILSKKNIMFKSLFLTINSMLMPCLGMF